MRRIFKTFMVIAATAALSAPVVAEATYSKIYNSYTLDVRDETHTWVGIVLCDLDADGNWVKGHYYRDSGSYNTVSEQRGKGYCSYSGDDVSNRVTKHRSQQIRDWATDPYGPWAYRP